MNRFQTAAENLRDRLRDTTTGAGVTATISRDGTPLATDIAVAQLDLRRMVRDESEFQLEDDDAAFLVGVDVLSEEPEQGDQIVANSIEYRVVRRNEIDSVWRWHDRSRVQRVIFCKEWN